MRYWRCVFDSDLVLNRRLKGMRRCEALASGTRKVELKYWVTQISLRSRMANSSPKLWGGFVRHDPFKVIY